MDDAQLAMDVTVFRTEIDRWNCCSEDEREEIYSETVARYWQRQVDPQRPPITNRIGWLLGTAKRVRLERHRIAIRDSSVRVQQLDKTGWTSLAANPNRESGQPSRRIPFEGSSAWCELSGLHRQLFLRVKVDGISLSVAATELGLNRSTAKSWIDRDRRKLSRDETLRTLAGVSTASQSEGTP